MVKHIILWNLKDEFDDAQKESIMKEIKLDLEGLQGKIEGLVDIKVQIEKINSSTADLMLDSTFVDEDALKHYSTHPEHVKVANEKVRPFTAVRSCLDFEF